MILPLNTFGTIFVRSRKWLCIILLMPAICSCKSSRNLDSQVDAAIQEEMQRLIQSVDSLRANVYMFRSESIERLSNLKLENKTIYLSAPDSTGRQYPTAVSKTKGESSRQESSRADTELYNSVAMLSVKVDSLAYKLDAALNKKEQIVELNWWDRNKDKVYIGFALIIVGWIVYKSRKK